MNLWRERFERWFRPVALHSPLSANSITVLALVLNLVAAVMLGFAHYRPHFFLIAPVVVGVAGLLDALDGIVARVRNEQSLFGDFLDHLFDRISDSALLAGYLYGASIRPELGYPALIAVMMTGYAGTQIEATYRVRSYEGVGRGEYVLAIFALPLFTWLLATIGLLHQRYSGLTLPEWLIALVTVVAIYTVYSRIARVPDQDGDH
ncbi:MAG: CDP-alcohol phosphatidyltransferase family protein [Acidobacteria bacterium]|nr:CDP-alcohol phosphatidyltransferase family protein [Acidobacteriota bacterium]